MMKKHFFLTLFCLSLSVFALAVLPTEADGGIYLDTVRLHILANSDSQEDQQIKLCVRDMLLEEYAEALKTEDPEQTIANARGLLSEMETRVEQFLAENGYGYGARLTLTEEWYETRAYEGFTMPAGQYLSLRVILGEGEGQNWWCVMYPPLCLDAALGNTPDDGIYGYTKEETTLIGKGKYRVRFKLLEMFSSVFSKI